MGSGITEVSEREVLWDDFADRFLPSALEGEVLLGFGSEMVDALASACLPRAKAGLSFAVVEAS